MDIKRYKLINHDYIKHKMAELFILISFNVAPSWKDSKSVWSHNPIVMPLNNWSNDILPLWLPGYRVMVWRLDCFTSHVRGL